MCCRSWGLLNSGIYPVLVTSVVLGLVTATPGLCCIFLFCQLMCFYCKCFTNTDKMKLSFCILLFYCRCSLCGFLLYMCAYFLKAFLGKSFQQLFFICRVNGLAWVRLNRLLGYLCWVSISSPGRQVITELNELCEPSWLYVKRRENKSIVLYSPLARTFHNCTEIFFSVGQKRARYY